MLHPEATGESYSAPPEPLTGGERNIPSPRTPLLLALRSSLFIPWGLAIFVDSHNVVDRLAPRHSSTVSPALRMYIVNILLLTYQSATATSSSLAALKSRMVCLSGCPGKWPLNRCSSSSYESVVKIATYELLTTRRGPVCMVFRSIYMIILTVVIRVF